METQKQKPELIQRLDFNQLLRHKARLLRLRDYLIGQLKVYDSHHEPIINFLYKSPIIFTESKQGYNYQTQIHDPFLEKYEKVKAVLLSLEKKLSEIEALISGGQKLFTPTEKPLHYHSITFDGLKLVEKRRIKNLTQEEFASAIGVRHKTTIGKWENNRVEPSFKMLCVYLTAVGVNIETAYNEVAPYLKTYKTDKSHKYKIIDIFKKYRERVSGNSGRKPCMTQVELAQKMGIDFKTVQEIERLELNLLNSIEVAYKITQVLGCKLSDLYKPKLKLYMEKTTTV